MLFYHKQHIFWRVRSLVKNTFSCSVLRNNEQLILGGVIAARGPGSVRWPLIGPTDSHPDPVQVSVALHRRQTADGVGDKATAGPLQAHTNRLVHLANIDFHFVFFLSTLNTDFVSKYRVD